MSPIPDEYATFCPDCNGSGEGMSDGSTCRTCGGSGEVWADMDAEEAACEVDE